MKSLLLELGKEKLLLDPNKLTLLKVKALMEDVAEVQAKYSPMAKYPMKAGESLSEYQERVQKVASEENKLGKNESSLDFAKKLFKNENPMKMFDLLKVIAKAADQEKAVTEETFDQTPYLSAKMFVDDVLVLYDLV